jgi:hypothetical protein
MSASLVSFLQAVQSSAGQRPIAVVSPKTVCSIFFNFLCVGRQVIVVELAIRNDYVQ